MGLLGSIGNLIGNAVNDLTAGTLGDLIPGIGDARAQERANQQNIELAQANRDWMERMSNSAYQRAMEDMRKAGLNPMLAYMQGGASVPTSTAATVESASKSAFGDAALGAFTGISAAQTQRMQAQTAQAQAQSSISLQGAQTAHAVAQASKTQAETAKTIDSIKNQKLKRELDRAQLRIEPVKASAAELANKGVDTIKNIGNRFLKNLAKPSFDEKGEYINPIKKWFQDYVIGRPRKKK